MSLTGSQTPKTGFLAMWLNYGRTKPNTQKKTLFKAELKKLVVCIIFLPASNILIMSSHFLQISQLLHDMYLISRMLFLRPAIFRSGIFATVTQGSQSTVTIIIFRTNRSGQTPPTQIRLLLIKVYTVCNYVYIFWLHYSLVTAPCSNFRIITAIFSGVRIIWINMVLALIDRGLQF